MTERERLDLLFGRVAALHYHTIRCYLCEGRGPAFGNKKHIAWLVAEIQALYDCLDEPVPGAF